MSDPITHLVELGFTPLEAEVYVCLLTDSPATGYRVAQVLGRPVAGVYKVLESLAARGAVVVDEGGSRLCRAVPADELLGRLEREFSRRRTAAAAALSEVRPSGEDDRVYQLRTAEQVMERCRAMLARSQVSALVDLWPGPLETLRGDLSAAAERGVRVSAQVYSPAEIAGVDVVETSLSPERLEAFPRPWVFLVSDAAELLLAFLSPEGDGVRQAVWTGSPYLAWTLHAFMASEFTFLSVLADPVAGPAAREAARRVSGRHPLETPGYRELLRRLGGDPASKPAGRARGGRQEGESR